MCTLSVNILADADEAVEEHSAMAAVDVEEAVAICGGKADGADGEKTEGTEAGGTALWHARHVGHGGYLGHFGNAG